VSTTTQCIEFIFTVRVEKTFCFSGYFSTTLSATTYVLLSVRKELLAAEAVAPSLLNSLYYLQRPNTAPLAKPWKQL